MPSLEQPRGQAIKKGGKKVEAAAVSGILSETKSMASNAELRAKVFKPEKIEKITTITKNPEERTLRVKIRNLEKRIENAGPEKKGDLEAQFDLAQTKLAKILSSKFEEAEERAEILKNIEVPQEEIEEAQKERQVAQKINLEKKTLLKRKIAEEKNPVERKKLRLQSEAVEEGHEPEKKIKKPAEESFTGTTIEDEEKIAAVREKIAKKNQTKGDEVYLSNWPKKEEAKPEEKPFTKTEEAWFQEGEKASENEEEMKKLEETAKKRSSAGLSPKVSAEEPQAVKAARKNLEESKKKLEEKGIDVDSITGGWVNRTQIKLQFGGFFSKKSKEIGALYDAYVKAQKEAIQMTAPTGDAAKQQLRGVTSGERGHSGGGFFKNR